jgi:hypothetical protein
MTITIDESLLSAPDTAKGQLQRVVLKHLLRKKSLGEIPTSEHFVFYELEQAGVVSKRSLNLDGSESKRKPTQNLNEAVTHLRKVGIIPWDWIIDESRQLTTWTQARTVLEYLVNEVEFASLDRFPGVARPVVLTESRAIGGVLERTVCEQWLVAVAPLGGKCLGFLVNEVAPLLEGEDSRALYLGDGDLSGDEIEDHTRRVLEHHTGRTFDKDTWERVLLTEKQIRDLQRRGIKAIEKRDERFSDGRPHLAYEAEAFGQAAVQRILGRRLEQLAPEPLKRVLEREQRQRAEALRLLRRPG